MFLITAVKSEDSMATEITRAFGSECVFRNRAQPREEGRVDSGLLKFTVLDVLVEVEAVAATIRNTPISQVHQDSIVINVLNGGINGTAVLVGESDILAKVFDNAILSGSQFVETDI